MNQNDKQHLKQLLDHCSECKIKVNLTKCKSRLKDYAGMNPCAAKSMGYKNIGKKEIIIDANLPVRSQVRNLRHELIEYHQMKDKKKPYFPAHRIALKLETKKTKWEK